MLVSRWKHERAMLPIQHVMPFDERSVLELRLQEVYGGDPLFPGGREEHSKNKIPDGHRDAHSHQLHYLSIQHEC
jgi:hypothetical protein